MEWRYDILEAIDFLPMKVTTPAKIIEIGKQAAPVSTREKVGVWKRSHRLNFTQWVSCKLSAT